MFRCDNCNKVTQPRQKLSKRVVETRDVTYRKGNKVLGKGTEIVKEINLGPCCI